MKRRIVLATPHQRFDVLERSLGSHPDIDVLRIRTREALTADALAGVAPEKILFPQWSWKVPASVFEAFECVIFHMTDVPYGRGGSPLQNLIVRGHTLTKLSALRCVAEMDAGPVYAKRDLTLDGTAEAILARAALLMHAMILDIVLTDPAPQAQTGEVVEFARRTPADSDITGCAALVEVFDRIRMLDGAGYPPAFVEADAFTIALSEASLGDGYVEARARITLRPGRQG